MTPSPLSRAFCFCCLPLLEIDSRRHHPCSRDAFVTILLASPASLRGQCSLSLTGEVLPKFVGFSIPTEMEMKDETQQSSGDKKRCNEIADEYHGSYASSSVTDRTQPTTKYGEKNVNNLTPPRTVHGMNNHASYDCSRRQSLTTDCTRHRQRIVHGIVRHGCIRI